MTLHGRFLCIAVEEAAICENLVKRTTEVLQKVFDAVVFCFTNDEQSVICIPNHGLGTGYRRACRPIIVNSLT